MCQLNFTLYDLTIDTLKIGDRYIRKGWNYRCKLFIAYVCVKMRGDGSRIFLGRLLIQREVRFSRWHKYLCGDARDHTWTICNRSNSPRAKSEYSPWFGPFHSAVSTRGHPGHQDHVLSAVLGRLWIFIHGESVALNRPAMFTNRSSLGSHSRLCHCTCFR